MDPNETHRRLREHLAYLSSHLPGSIGDRDVWADHAAAAYELLVALDTWLTHGGFGPDADNHAAQVPGLDGRIRFVRGDEIRIGDVLLFTAREVSAVDASALTIRAATGSGTEDLDRAELGRVC